MRARWKIEWNCQATPAALIFSLLVRLLIRCAHLTRLSLSLRIVYIWRQRRTERLATEPIEAEIQVGNWAFLCYGRGLSLSLVSNERTPKSLGKSFFVFDTFYKLLVWYAALAKSLLSRPPSLHVAMPSSSIHNPALISLRKKKKGKKEEEEENDNLAERVGGAMPAADGNAPQ